MTDKTTMSVPREDMSRAGDLAPWLSELAPGPGWSAADTARHALRVGLDVLERKRNRAERRAELGVRDGE